MHWIARKLIMFSFLVVGLFLNAGETGTPGNLTAADQESLRYVRLDLFIDAYNHEVRSGADLERLFFKRVSKAQMQGMHDTFLKLGKVPALTRKDNTLLFKFADFTVQVKWPDLNRNQFVIEGVDWTFDSSAPIQPQLDSLDRKFKKAATHKDAWLNFDWVLPKAEAQLPAVAAKVILKANVLEKCAVSRSCTFVGLGLAAGVVNGYGGDIKDFTGKVGCWMISWSSPWSRIGICQGWKDDIDAKNAKTIEKGLKAATMDPNRRWVVRGKPECPADTAIGGEKFSAWMREIEIQKDKDGKDIGKEKGNWFYLSSKTKAGRIIEMSTYTNQVDSKAPDAKDRVKAIIVLDPDKTDKPVLDRILIRNKGDQQDVMDTEFHTILPTDDEAVLHPDERDIIPKMQNLAEGAQKWVDACRMLAFNGLYDKEQTQNTVQSIIDQPTGAPATSIPASTTSPGPSTAPPAAK